MAFTERHRPYSLYKHSGVEWLGETMGSTHRTIYMPDVGEFATPLPPIEEQREIIDHIRVETAKIDLLVAKVHAAIDRLKELHTALIAAAVTGKIDVRDDTTANPETAS